MASAPSPFPVTPVPVSERTSLSRAALNLVIVALVALAAGELISRTWLTSPSAQDYDAAVGWVWRPGAGLLNASEGGARIVVSPEGLIDAALAPKAGRRVLALGNSFTEAIQVPVDQNFTSITEALVPGVDVVNGGRSAMGPAHYPLVLERLDPVVHPDLTVVVVGEGDLVHLLGPDTVVQRDSAGTMIRLRPAALEKDRLKQLFAPALDRSALATWMMRRLKPVILGWITSARTLFTSAEAEPAAAQDLDDEAWREAAGRLAVVLSELQRRTPVVVLDIPHIRYDVGRVGVRASPDESMAYAEAARIVGVAYVDAGPELIAQYAETGQPGHGFPNNAIGSGHLNERGHGAVAKALASWLKAHAPAPARAQPTPPGGPAPAAPPKAAPARVSRLAPVSATAISAVWANEGGDKVTRGELRASKGQAVVSRAFDGGAVHLFGARNETVSVQVILEAATETARGVTLDFDRLVGPGGATITSKHVEAGAALFDTVGRPIERFVVRYLPIRGLSRLTWGDYDERHVPERFRRPYDKTGHGKGLWADRPDADAYYPDIAVPAEAVGKFDIPEGSSQAVWIDLFIPKDTPPGRFEGTITVSEAGLATWRVPITLDVRRFTLPDVPTGKTMLQLGYADINQRYFGKKFPDVGDLYVDGSVRVRDRHFQMAHRHRISVIDSNYGPDIWDQDAPRPGWKPRLDGTLFTAAHGYDGPGVGVGNGVFSIGTYGQWSWKDGGEAAMWQHLDAWTNWFADVAPGTELFLYLIDESEDYDLIERWSKWVRSNPGPGRAVRSFATLGLPWGAKFSPSLDIACSTLKVGQRTRWERALADMKAEPRRRFFLYNGGRPATGSLALEDDGVALRMWGWTQFKVGADRWFVWESTYYNNFQGGRGETNVFRSAHTFGGQSESRSPELGETGWNYTNGDGVLFYPGTDTSFPEDSYELPGPIASLRLKHWRRGLQDHDYLVMASQVDAARTRVIVQRLVPRVLWENDVDSPLDPTYVRTDIGWKTDPDLWEGARAELADLIESAH